MCRRAGQARPTGTDVFRQEVTTTLLPPSPVSALCSFEPITSPFTEQHAKHTREDIFVQMRKLCLVMPRHRMLTTSTRDHMVSYKSGLFCADDIYGSVQWHFKPLLHKPLPLSLHREPTTGPRCWRNAVIIKTVNGNIISEWPHNATLIVGVQLAEGPSWLCARIDFIIRLIWCADKRQIHTERLNDCHFICFQGFSSLPEGKGRCGFSLSAHWCWSCVRASPVWLLFLTWRGRKASTRPKITILYEK